MNRMKTGAFRILSILLILFILSNLSRSFLGDPDAGCRHLHDTGSFRILIRCASIAGGDLR